VALAWHRTEVYFTAKTGLLAFPVFLKVFGAYPLTQANPSRPDGSPVTALRWTAGKLTRRAAAATGLNSSSG